MNLGRKSSSPKKAAGGFSLAETALAVGIAASVTIILVGMIPVSLESLRQSSNTAAEARIVQAIAADYRMREWTDIVQQQRSGGSQDYTFDGQGTRVESGHASSIFTVRVTVDDAPALPGMPQSNPRLKSVRMLITDRPNPGAAFAKPEICRKAQTLVPQIDRDVEAPPLVSK